VALLTTDSQVLRWLQDDLELEWSLDGQAVSLLYRQQPIAFVTASDRPGHSRAVTKAYDQAKPWNEDLYQKLFRPKDRDSLLKRGMALHDQRDFNGALQAYGEILSGNPKDTVALYESGASAMVIGDHARCLAFARRGLASSNDIPLKTKVALHSLTGSCEDLAGNVDASLAEFNAGLALAPRDAQINFNAGVTLAKANRFDAARGYLKTAMEAALQYASPYLIYAQLLHKEGNPAAALPLYLRFLMMEPNSPRRGEVAGYIVTLLRQGARLENGKPVVTVNYQ
jgi:tetratricopeptide (TPR) repeat protein